MFFVMTCPETLSNVQELSGESRAPLVVDDERALVVELHGMHSVLRLGTQPEDLPHAAPHFDPVPSLSSDSDVGDLPVDPVASSRDPSVFRACQVVLFVSGTRTAMRSFW